MSSIRKPTSQQMVDYMAPKTKRIEKLFRGFLNREEMKWNGTWCAYKNFKR